jgi:integrase
MPFIVRRNPNGRQAKFKLYIQTEKAGVREQTYIAPKDFPHYGFDSRLSFEEAAALRTALNKQSALKVVAERRSRIHKEIKEKDAALSAFVSDEEGFREYVSRTQRSANFTSSKFTSHWRATKRMLAALRIAPDAFEDSKRLFYRYFAEKQFAPSYCVKLLRCLNLYGKFYAKKYKVHVEHIPQPNGYDLSDVADAHFEKKPHGGASSPLKLSDLAKLESGLSPEQYRWMYISLWCGLRPHEVNSLHKAGTYRWEVKEGVDILCVFQSKLKKLTRERRWKRIPMVEPEQACIKEMVEAKAFSKPLVKTVQRILDETYTCYAGRKGFEPLMKGRGQDFVNISRWLGHQDLNRTFKDYGDLMDVSFKKKSA